jgi:hypothetical protein
VAAGAIQGQKNENKIIYFDYLTVWNSATIWQDTAKSKPCDLKLAKFILCEKQFESHVRNTLSKSAAISKFLCLEFGFCDLM